MTTTDATCRAHGSADLVETHLTSLCHTVSKLMDALCDPSIRVATLLPAGGILDAARRAVGPLVARLREEDEDLQVYRNQVDHYENTVGELRQEADTAARALDATRAGIADLRDQVDTWIAQAPAATPEDAKDLLWAIGRDLATMLDGQLPPRQSARAPAPVYHAHLTLLEVVRQRSLADVQEIAAIAAHEVDLRRRSDDRAKTADQLLGRLLSRLQQRRHLHLMSPCVRPSVEEMESMEAGLLDEVTRHLCAGDAKFPVTCTDCGARQKAA